MLQKILLFDDYNIQPAQNITEFWDYFERHRLTVFGESTRLNEDLLLSPNEIAAIKKLAQNLGQPFQLNWYICKKDEIIGWTCGIQNNDETFYMRNTGIFEPHRNKGIYSAMLPVLLQFLKDEGFQCVQSKHVISNNAILIPKLKSGFLITAVEVSAMFGLMVYLTYYFNQHRKNLFEYRTGFKQPTPIIKHTFGL
ncbi:MAG TPA: GNAT family N-acetyltransferase [Chitinophagales bacterium]|nr:GNAT family N-acetyltransferase [Chitinophagales bacterium]